MSVPALRFKSDDGRDFPEWNEKQLGSIASFSKGKGISKADIDSDGATLCIRYGELYTEYGETISDVKSKTNLAIKNLVLSEVNDVIIPASGETQIDIATASCVQLAGVALGGDLNIIKTQENGVFLSYYLNSQKKLDIAKLAQGNSVVHLYSSQLKLLDINFPSIPEQTKIANFLTAVDEKITQLTQKHDLLTQYKKGVMQQIFSRELRFKDDDGGDFPEWEEKQLGQLCSITTGKLDANAMVEDGQYRFYTCAREYYQIDKYTFDTEALLISGNGANVGYIHYYKGKFNAYQRTYVLDGFKQNIIFIKYFLDEFLHVRIFKEAKEGNTPYIVMGTLTDMEIKIPSLPEQTKIANFLTAIDDKITATQTQLQAVKQYKQGLLQQMFV